MPFIEAEFEVFCACGNGLCNLTTTLPPRGRYKEAIQIIPCEKCLDAARGEGYDEGYDKGWDRGYDSGLADGREENENA